MDSTRRGEGGLRIAHVLPMTLDLYGHKDEDFGGSVKFFLPNLPLAQLPLGHRPTVHLLAADRPRTLSVDGVPVHFHRCVEPPRFLGTRARFSRQVGPGILRAIREDRVDLVHFQGLLSHQAMYAAVAWRAARQGVPLVAQDQGPRPVGPVMTRVHAYALRRTAACLAGSEYHASVLARLGVDSNAVHLVPNGVDPAVFHPDPEWKPREGRLRVLVVSRLTPDKDPFTMVTALAALAQEGSDVEVTIISRGSLKDQVDQRLRAAGVRATFFEHVSQEDLGVQYRSADVLVHTSLQEGSNQAIREAMACGLPVVATNIPGIRESVGDAGILLPTGEPAGFADALRHLLEEPQARAEYRRRVLDRARSFTWEVVAEQVDDIYRQIRSDGATSRHRGRISSPRVPQP